MYPIKIPFILIIIPVLVISEEFWYPATMTEKNIPNFVIANNFYDNNITRGFDINSTTVKDDQKIHRHDITEHRKPTFSNQSANSEKSSPTHIYGNMSSESENNQKRKYLGNMIRNKFSRNILGRAKTINNTAKSRFLDVFQVVEFEHVLCSSASGLEGKCLHDYDCQTIGGSSMGTCADGYGICCVIVFSCHGHTSEPVGWFTNPEYPLPNTDRLSCALTLNKTSQDIKQIRLDFANFELLPPTGGTCENDQFVVSGQNINSVIPILCGMNTGQHIYIEVGDTEGPVRLTIQTITADSRLFSIKVTQLMTSDILAAPTGCLQYFNGPHGYIESFNYRNISEVTTAMRPSYLNNLNYAICIKRETSSCSITYTNENEMQIVNYDTDGLPIIPPRQAGVEIFNCPSDWLLISAVRLCGERLNDGSVLQDFYLDAPVTDIGAGPITIWFRSDEGYVGRGFKLKYQQNLCTISTRK